MSTNPRPGCRNIDHVDILTLVFDECQPEPREVTAEEAAVMLRRSVRTVHSYAAAGRLTPIRHSTRRVRFDVDEIAALIEEQQAS